MVYCPSCGMRLGKDWKYCPECGTTLEKRWFDYDFFSDFSTFDDLFREFHEQTKKLDKLMKPISRDFEVLDITPWFKEIRPRVKSGGFSIKIVQRGNRPPQVDVKTFGDIDEKAADRIIERFKIPKAQIRKEKKERRIIEEIKPKIEEEKPKVRRVPLVTEEPKSALRRVDDKIIIEMELPEVKSERDIDIKKLGESIEVKAFTDDKAYFKIIRVPIGVKIAKKALEEGKLSIF
ncbi:MAG: zinc ribbon domain-containing protein, partial [Euryarchaeota archaeon]|nr:zinc ribbon domain-containing protein [Euryarchaeota archaeon]